MLEIIKILENKLSGLDLTDEDKEQLFGICEKLRKQVEKSEYKLTTTLDAGESTKSLMSAMLEEIEQKKNLIEIQNETITDSIQYALRIQSALFPPEAYINELLPENFILFKPLEIVSGDFYWVKHINNYIIIVAADCTGHGVPGAFMSMLGISFLNEIVQQREITQANEVLNELRRQIKRSLRQHGKKDGSKDGMDIAICILDTKTNIMQYAGANNSLYLIQDINGKPALKEIKADKMPVGIYVGKEKSFTNHEIQLEIGDTFYIFSDGFADQKNREEKKFLSKNFKDLLIQIQDQSMDEQKETLEISLNKWMKDCEQIDDILVIGVMIE